MTDKKMGAIFVPLKWILYILSLVYCLGIFIRRIFYQVGIFKKNKAPLKIISVGNLTLGGTGKTPFVIALSRILKEDLKIQASILIRGYGWDEQAMLNRNLPDVPILVGENRVRASHRAIKLYGSDTAILDDGFQYWELERNLDIVLIDSRQPFGNGHLFPRGILREPKESIGRSDVVVFTKVNKKTFDIDAMKEDLRAFNTNLVFLEAVHRPKYLYDVKSRKKTDLSILGQKRVILVSSIGDPLYFEETVKDLGSNVIEHIVFGDHHNYREKDIQRIIKRCDERSFDLIVTTQKDEVKLNRMKLSFGTYLLMTLVIEMEVTSGKEILIDRLHSLYSR